MNGKGLSDYIRKNIEELKSIIGNMSSGAEIQEFFEGLGFSVPAWRVNEVVRDIYTGVLNVSVREMTVIHSFGLRSFTPIEFNYTPLLESEIALWLGTNGYLTSEHTYLCEPANSKTGEYGWSKYAVCWHTDANKTYFVYVTRGMTHAHNVKMAELNVSALS